MDFNQVRYFLALANTLNFTRAAEQCYVTQPALTQSIRRLEAELGGDLITRHGRETGLTELGRALRNHFEQIERTRHLVRSTAKAVLTGESGELNIGIMCTVGPALIMPMLDDFLMSHPFISIVLHNLTPQNIQELVLSGAIDGAFFGRNSAVFPNLRHIELFSEEMMITFHKDHEFALRSEVPLAEIANHRYVERLHCEFREEFANFFVNQGLNLNVGFRCEREDWIQNLVINGFGISLIPKYSIQDSKLHFRPIKDPSLVRYVDFIVPKEHAHNEALNNFISYLVDFDWLQSI